MALYCLVFEKITFYLHFGDRQTNKQTDEQMDNIDALSRSRYREWRLKNEKFRSRKNVTTRRCNEVIAADTPPPTTTPPSGDSPPETLILTD